MKWRVARGWPIPDPYRFRQRGGPPPSPSTLAGRFYRPNHIKVARDTVRHRSLLTFPSPRGWARFNIEENYVIGSRYAFRALLPPVEIDRACK